MTKTLMWPIFSLNKYLDTIFINKIVSRRLQKFNPFITYAINLLALFILTVYGSPLIILYRVVCHTRRTSLLLIKV
jgi:hypothetical protein